MPPSNKRVWSILPLAFLFVLCYRPAQAQESAAAQEALALAKRAESKARVQRDCDPGTDELFKRALILAEGSEHYTFLQVSQMWGSYLSSRMRYAEARKAYEKQLGVARTVDNKLWIANTIVSIANMDRKLCETKKVTPSRLQYALKIAKGTKEEKDVRRELCYTLAHFGQFDAANDMIQENLKLGDFGGSDYAELAILEVYKKEFPKSLKTILLANQRSQAKDTYWKLYVDAVREVDETNRTWGNFQNSIAELLATEKFDSLETLGAQLRKETVVNPKGYRRLYGFYVGLAMAEQKIAAGESLEEHLLHWVKAKPKSSLALTALASCSASKGWKARGTGFAYTVGEEQRKKFSLQLSESLAMLKEARKLGPVDEHWYGLKLDAALNGDKMTKLQFDAIFDEGIKQFPLSQELYYEKSHYLQPRWHGAPGEFEKWLNSACDKIGGAAGDKMYARIVWQMDSTFMYPDLFPSLPGLSWERVKRGMNLLKKEYPNSMALRAELAKLADENNDPAATNSAFTN